MNRFYFLAVCGFFCCLTAYSQEPDADTLRKDALKLYMEVGDHVRQEITYVNYVRDLKEADVYVLRTSQATGAGGREHTFFIRGRGRFAGMDDTLSYTAFPDDTQEITRRKEIQTLQMGLMRYVAKTPLSGFMDIRFNQPVSSAIPTDRWNNWVFRSGMSGFLNGQKSMNYNYIGANLSANRVTEESKLETSLHYNRNEDNFIISGQSISSLNRSGNGGLLYVKSINDHWSAGGSTSIGSSTFSNLGMRISLLPGIEYNIFPYSESTRRQFRILYRAGMEYNDYLETTIYDKDRETLGVHYLSAAYGVIQSWGSVNVSCNWRNYLHDFSKRNLSLNGFLNIRLFKGLSISLQGGASLVHDQLSLVKSGLTDEEILLRRRELETNYRYFGSFGINYTFGSIYTNVVNPRFGSSPSGF